MSDKHDITVSEDKFNGTSTIEVTNAPSKKHAKKIARRFFREEYGHNPSKIVAEKEELGSIRGEDRYTVMVADHSSGSLKETKQYDMPKMDGD